MLYATWRWKKILVVWLIKWYNPDSSLFVFPMQCSFYLIILPSTNLYFPSCEMDKEGRHETLAGPTLKIIWQGQGQKPDAITITYTQPYIQIIFTQKIAFIREIP